MKAVRVGVTAATLMWLAAAGCTGGGDDVIGTPCAIDDPMACGDYAYCNSCRDTPHIGPYLTCTAYGPPERYLGVDPYCPYLDACDDDHPCPAPYECVLTDFLEEDPRLNCLLPCNGRDCPLNFYCSGVDNVEYSRMCGYCVTYREFGGCDEPPPSGP